ncbi:MAG: hypothetical protein HY840_06605 [Bacteroidetes bacterium]|nr:hypothetical protein [Bacteroidota bacterium]
MAWGKLLFISVCVCFLNSTSLLFAQQIAADTALTSADKNPQKDIGDVWRSVVKKKAIIKSDSSHEKGSRRTLIPLLYPGYALVTGFQIVLTTNFSFYADHSKNAKISSILMNNLYTQYNQIINLINSNIWTNNKKFNFLGDYRLYKFPTNTFGLGSTSTFAEKQHVDYSYLKIYEVGMRKITGNLSGGMGYDFDYHWNVTATKISTSDSTDFEKYGVKKTTSSSGITLNLQYDSRLNSNNPAKGTYAFLELRTNLKALGSNDNWQSVLLDVRKYIQTSKKSGNVLALWSYNWITVHGPIPYFDLPSLGWDHYNNMGRGYVQGRFRAWNMIYAEAEYRFRLTKNGLIGGVLFSNASTLTEYPSNKWKNINPGGGLGLRIKMNKSSKTNFAIDYGFGVGGSRGFSFNLNEIF